MTLSDISSVVGVISGLAVLGSLVYLAQQTRQNTKHTRALIFQGSAELALGQYRGAVDLAEAIIIGNGGTVTPEEIKRVRFRLVCSLYWVVWDNFFAQHDEGLVNEQHFERIRWAFVQQLRTNPGIRDNFKQVLSALDAPDHRFHVFLQELIAESASPRSSGNGTV